MLLPLTPGLVWFAAQQLEWAICANVGITQWCFCCNTATGSLGRQLDKQVNRRQGQKCTKTGKPGEKYVIFEQVQVTPVIIMLSGDVSGPLVPLCSLDTLQRCRRPAAAALQTLQPDCRPILRLGGQMGADNTVRHPPQLRGQLPFYPAIIIISTWAIRADKVKDKCGQMEEFNH